MELQQIEDLLFFIMNHQKPQTRDSLMSKSATVEPVKLQNTKKFLNRFNDLPSYNAIHSKAKLQKHCKFDAIKLHHIKEKIPLHKLQLQCYKNKKSKRNIDSSEISKSERRSRIIKALMCSKKSTINQKLMPNTRISINQQRQTVPSAQEMCRNSKIKVNIQRLSLKINYNYYPYHDLDLRRKNQKRYSFVPKSHAESDPILRLEAKDSINDKKMSRSFVRLKDVVFDESENKNRRQTKISSNILDSLKNSVINQGSKENQSGRMKFPSRLNRDWRVEDKKSSDIGSKSIKRQISKPNYKNTLIDEQKLRKKVSINSQKRFNTVRTELKESEKENYPYNINLLPVTNYVKNNINTEHIYTLESRRDFQQNIKENYNHLKTNLHFNPISILHPEGEFAGFFESQFNPW